MKRGGWVWLWFVLLAGILAGNAQAAPDDHEKRGAAIEAARAWLALVDAGDYQRSWQEAAGLFRRQVAQETWVSEISRLRPRFGEVVKRSLQSAKYMTSAPGMPAGEYVLIVFKTSFASKKTAAETLTPMRDPDGNWRVAGYFIR